MSLESERLLDDVGWQLLRELQANARLSFSELGRRVGLTPPAVADRVRRMEEAGIIRGYRLEGDHAKGGLPLTAGLPGPPPGGERPRARRDREGGPPGPRGPP